MSKILFKKIFCIFFEHIKNISDFSIIKIHFFFYFHKTNLIFYKVTIFFRFLKTYLIFFFYKPKSISFNHQNRFEFSLQKPFF